MASLDGTPFLVPRDLSPSTSSVRSQGLRHAAAMIRRASTSRRPFNHPSTAVRESAAQEIEDRQLDWAYSPPVVLLDAAWNSVFIAAASAALLLSRRDSPRFPLRLWALGYALQCVVHVVCVCVEYRRRRAWRRDAVDGADYGGDESSSFLACNCLSSATIRQLESANTMFSFIWWIVGFYWICTGGHDLQQESPVLYWLCIVFLVLDLFFVMFCVALASVIAAAVCCCLPCIIAILYVLADRGGASKEDIELLPKYIFQRNEDEEKLNEDTVDTPGPCGGIMKDCEMDSPMERRLTAEDAECCICISPYEDGIELRELPCGHHFHSACVDKWLYINSTCPLCKYDISKRYNRDGEV